MNRRMTVRNFALALLVAPLLAGGASAQELTKASLRLKWLPRRSSSAITWPRRRAITPRRASTSPSIPAVRTSSRENMVASGTDTFGHGGGVASLLQAREKGPAARRHRHAVPGDALPAGRAREIRHQEPGRRQGQDRLDLVHRPAVHGAGDAQGEWRGPERRQDRGAGQQHGALHRGQGRRGDGDCLQRAARPEAAQDVTAGRCSIRRRWGSTSPTNRSSSTRSTIKENPKLVQGFLRRACGLGLRVHAPGRGNRDPDEGRSREQSTRATRTRSRDCRSCSSTAGQNPGHRLYRRKNIEFTQKFLVDYGVITKPVDLDGGRHHVLGQRCRRSTRRSS